jgi:hypothetical protein
MLLFSQKLSMTMRIRRVGGRESAQGWGRGVHDAPATGIRRQTEGAEKHSCLELATTRREAVEAVVDCRGNDGVDWMKVLVVSGRDEVAEVEVGSGFLLKEIAGG